MTEKLIQQIGGIASQQTYRTRYCFQSIFYDNTTVFPCLSGFTALQLGPYLKVFFSVIWQITLQLGHCSLTFLAIPVRVPPVPAPITTMSTWPRNRKTTTTQKLKHVYKSSRSVRGQSVRSYIAPYLTHHFGQFKNKY